MKKFVFLINIVSIDQTEGSFNDAMRQEQNSASRFVALKTEDYTKKALASASSSLRTALHELDRIPLLTQRVREKI